MTRQQSMLEARQWLGLLAFWGVLYVCMFGYPIELNMLLGVSNLLATDDQLNGPHDLTMLIRVVLGLAVGGAANILVLKVLGKLFPTAVLAAAKPIKSVPIKQLK